MKTSSIKLLTMLAVVNSSILPAVEACTKFTYMTKDNAAISARSWDWPNDGQANLWAFPAGVSRSGNGDDKNSAHWVSKYGSVITGVFNAGTADGINTAGLSVNALYLAGSNYGTPAAERKNLTIFTWVQYILDNYATVNEAVSGFDKAKFNMLEPVSTDGYKMDLHVSLSDVNGDNAVLEYIDGKLVIYHSKQYNVMTNEPPFDEQLALAKQWQKTEGKFLPGSSDPADRFARTTYYLNTAMKNAKPTDSYQQELASVFSIIRNASIPFGQSDPKHPNVDPTQWRSVADMTHKVYYFEEANRPNIFWVDLNKLDLKPGAPIKKLTLTNGESYAGEVSKNFVIAQPFTSPQITINKK